MQAAADANLFIYLRLGPYICAEYSWGGMPYWLREDGGCKVRTIDPKWTAPAARWLDYITRKVEPMLARNGGPVIIFQLENEYGNIEASYGPEGKQWLQWNVDKAVNLSLSVPLAMCSQMDAPQSVLSTYNGWYADDWIPTFRAAYPNRKPTPHPHFERSVTAPAVAERLPSMASHPQAFAEMLLYAEPPMWTELWMGWFQAWTEATPTRPVEDIVFAALRWYIRGGAYTAYYTMYGGTTLGRQTGQPELRTDYDFDSPIDVYGVPHPRKYPHIERLHAALAPYLGLMLHSPASEDIVLPNDCRLNEYNSTTGKASVAFLTNANSGSGNDFNVSYAGRMWPVTAWSTQVIDVDSMTVVFDTSKVTNARLHEQKRRRDEVVVRAAPSSVQWASDQVGAWGRHPIIAQQPLEQLTLTYDRTDYLWYVTGINITQQQIAKGSVQLKLPAQHDYVYAFISGRRLAATTSQTGNVTLALAVDELSPGRYELQLLNANNGVDDYGAFLETVTRGLVGALYVDGSDITNSTWRHQIGLRGESERYYALDSGVTWSADVAAGLRAPLTWWRWNMSTPQPQSPINGATQPTWQLDVRGLGKGEMWVNGHSIGRFYNATSPSDSCTPCDTQSYYSGPQLCRVGCGQYTQPYLHVPRSFLEPVGGMNVVVAFAELIGDPLSLTLRQRN